VTPLTVFVIVIVLVLLLVRTLVLVTGIVATLGEAMKVLFGASGRNCGV